MGLGDQGHLSIATLPDPRIILDLPPTTRAGLQTRLDRAVREATQILHRHRDLLDDLTRDLEATGFLGEAELEERLGAICGQLIEAAGAAGPETPQDPPPPAQAPSDHPDPSDAMEESDGRSFSPCMRSECSKPPSGSEANSTDPHGQT